MAAPDWLGFFTALTMLTVHGQGQIWPLDQDPMPQGKGLEVNRSQTHRRAHRSTAALRLLNDVGGFGKRGCSPDDHGVEAKQMVQAGGRGASEFRRNGSPKMMLRLGLVGEKRSSTCRAREQASSGSGDAADRKSVV